MSKIIIAIIVACCVHQVIGQTLNSPESIDFHTPTNTWYISNSNSILAMDSQGNLSTFTTNVTSTYGIEVVNDFVYVLDSRSVKVFSLSSGSLERIVTIPGAGFLNGITFDGTQYVWFTDFSTGKVWKLDITTYLPSLVVTYIGQSPNGIYYDQSNDMVYVVGFTSNASVYSINPNTAAVTTLITTTQSSFDGITKGCDGNFYVSAWGSQSLLKFDENFSSAPTVVMSGLSSPSDIYFNASTNQVAIPNSGNNSISYHDVDCDPVGTTQKNTSFSPQIYPTLISNFINIKGLKSSSTLKIHAADGKLIITKIITDDTQIDVSVLAPGTYFASIRSIVTNELTTQTLIKN
jgi:hypothetical protein